jgi:primosomal protein N' (replication factor Y) (superfamily II helicase)
MTIIARVALDLSLDKTFDYLIPPELAGQIQSGSRVKVPFGKRELLGSVMALLDHSPHSNLKLVLKVLGPRPLLIPQVMDLARWMADYYCCPFELALKSALPEAVRKEKSGWRAQLWVRWISPPGQIPKLTGRQREILKRLEEVREIPLKQFLQTTNSTAALLRKLECRCLLEIREKIQERDPYGDDIIIPSAPLELNPEQNAALGAISAALQNPARAGKFKPVFLLHGVTGSGKTEVYLQSIAKTLELGRGAIVLVPEIALTPQTVERFKARFSTGPLQTLVAVLHSHLSSGERHDEWQKILQGRARIVIGARSAVFAPVNPLGLIIVDEEHESSYKQEEAPRYHARDVAVMRGRMEQCVVVLGSATPSLESYYNARNRKYSLLEMTVRADDKKLPLVRVVDMRHEFRKEKGIPIFSQLLKSAIERRLEQCEQTILFLNRRGYASSLQCPKCGYVAGCPNCSISLTYHRQESQLRCHICGHTGQVPDLCPACRNPAIRFAGIGTEKVEEALRKLFPRARVQRMDSDILKRKNDYRLLLGDFRSGKIDILLGTQMIAKGLHFPNVTLVGIVYADLSLHIPDFRAGERTFQLLTQVAGRAGRGEIEGEVFVQSFTPFHPAIQYARRHDFQGFYEQELEFRQQLQYPPVSRVALLTIKGKIEEKVRFTAECLKRELEQRLSPFDGLVMAGPAPAPLARAETWFRYHLMLRIRQMSKLSQSLALELKNFKCPEEVSVTVDIDPVNLM